jgi:hypothetical protein
MVTFGSPKDFPYPVTFVGFDKNVDQSPLKHIGFLDRQRTALWLAAAEINISDHFDRGETNADRSKGRVSGDNRLTAKRFRDYSTHSYNFARKRLHVVKHSITDN